MIKNNFIKKKSNYFLSTIIFLNFFKYGIHLGHSIKNSVLDANWMLYALRSKTWIIDLNKTLILFRQGYKFIRCAIINRKPIWFINKFSFTNYSYLKYFALKCGEFFMTSQNWIRGSISNFRYVNFAYYGKLTKQFVHYSLNINLYKQWLFTRYSWPRAVLISSAHDNPSIVYETGVSLVTPLIICDTNFKSDGATFAIPGNDSSFDSIIFYNELVCSWILYFKIKSVINWLKNIRFINDHVKVIDWIYKFNQITSKKTWIDFSSKSLFVYNFSLYKLFSKFRNFFGANKNKVDKK